MKFSTTFVKTADAVKKIYDELPKIEKLLNDLYYTPMPVGFDPPQVDAYAASQKVKEFCEMAAGAQVFLPQDVSNNLEAFCETLGRIANNLGMRELSMQGGEVGPMEEVLIAVALLALLFTSVLGAFMFTKGVSYISIAEHNLQRDANVIMKRIVGSDLAKTPIRRCGFATLKSNGRGSLWSSPF